MRLGHGDPILAFPPSFEYEICPDTVFGRAERLLSVVPGSEHRPDDRLLYQESDLVVGER